MDIKELNNLGIEKLKNNNIEDYIYKSNRLLQFVLNMTKEELIINIDKQVGNHKKHEYLLFIDELINGKPLQYITNCQEFMKLKFYVNENVLIPQPDTEILVERTLDVIKNKYNENNCNILDLCTGSGIIGISLKKYMPNVTITASDISSKALDVACLNAKNNDVEINFINSNMFNNIHDKFNLIVSNPPYIESSEISKLAKDVQNEPLLALDGGEDGLSFYRIIRDEAYKFLEKDGAILLEIGYNQKEKVLDLFKNNSFYKNIEFYKDLSKIDRVIKIEKS